MAALYMTFLWSTSVEIIDCRPSPIHDVSSAVHDTLHSHAVVYAILEGQTNVIFWLG